MNHKFIKDTAIVSSGTMISRVLGFFRDILIASVFGTSWVFEAFVVAFRLPNMFRSVLAEGFADSVATPVLSEYQNQQQRLLIIAGHLLVITSVLLFIVTGLGILFSRQLVALMAPGFIVFPEKFNLAVSYARITFFYLFLIGVSANACAVLYAFKKFWIPALTPAVMNLVFIAGVFFFGKSYYQWILVWCVIIAGVLELIIPLAVLFKQGFCFHTDLVKAFKDSDIIRMVKMFVPRVWASVIYHLSVFVDTIYASLSWLCGAGALAAMYYADRLMQLPLAIIALSVARVAMVDLSLYAKEGRLDEFKRLMLFSLENIVFFVVPICCAFIFLAEPMIKVLFARGNFDSQSLGLTVRALSFYSAGLFFFCAVKVMANSLYALKDSASPAKTATICLIINALASGLLIFPLGIGGVTLGSSIAAMVNCFLLAKILKKHLGQIVWQPLLKVFLKVLILSLICVFVCRIIWISSGLNKYLTASLMLLIGLSLFSFGGHILKLKQVSYLRNKLIQKFSSKPV